MSWSPETASAAYSTPVASARPTQRSIWSAPGTCLQPGPRDVLRRALACDDLEWERGKAWAFQQAMGLVWYYVNSNPTMSTMGRQTLNRILHSMEPAGR